MNPLIKMTSLAILCTTMAGCADQAILKEWPYPSHPSALVPRDVAVTNTFDKTVRLTAIGEHDTHANRDSQVSDESLAGAVQVAIERSDVFSSVIRPEEAAASKGQTDYELEVRLIRLSQRTRLFTRIVDVEISWQLTKCNSDRTLWRWVTHKSHGESVGDALLGPRLERVAKEGGIRESIKEGVERISTLLLDPGEPIARPMKERKRLPKPKRLPCPTGKTSSQ